MHAHIVKMSNVQICNLLHPLPFMHVLINLITLCTHLPMLLLFYSPSFYGEHKNKCTPISMAATFAPLRSIIIICSAPPGWANGKPHQLYVHRHRLLMTRANPQTKANQSAHLSCPAV